MRAVMSASRELLCAALVALMLLFLQLMSGVELRWTTIPALAVLGYVPLVAGRLLLAAAGERNTGAPEAWSAGLLAICLASYALGALLPVSAAASLSAVAVVVIGIDAASARKGVRSPADWRSVVGFALCAAFTAAWCAVPAAAYETLRTQGVLPVWSDYFFHGGIISQLGDARAFGRGSIYLADYPASFYHFASYGPAAALAGVLDQPGLALAGAVWLPLGFLAMLAGAYALGARLAGAAGGLAALAALAIVPDAASYGLRNGYMSFHWTLMAHPGATYALGAAFVSLACLDRWAGERSRGLLVMSALFAVSTLFFRAHIFLLCLPAWLGTAALCSVRPGGRKARVAAYAAAVLVAGAFAASVILEQLAASGSGFWRFGDRALADFLWVVHTGQEPTAYDGLYERLMATGTPVPLTLGIGVLLAVVAGLGGFVVLLPAAALLAWRARVLKPIDAACGYLFLCWLLLMATAPKPWHTDPTDLIQRPLVLLYAACAIWTLCLVVRVLAARPGMERRLWPALAAAAIVALPLIAANAGPMARPKFRWGAHDAAARIPPGLFEAAAYLRSHARAGDVFAAAGLTANYVPFDVSSQLCALAGVPAYLSRPYLEMIKDAPRKKLVAARLAALDAVAALDDERKAMQALQALKVQWYVVAGEPGPRWDPARSRAAFRSGEVTLYRTP